MWIILQFKQVKMDLEDRREVSPPVIIRPGNTKSGVKIEAASWEDKDVTELMRKKIMILTSDWSILGISTLETHLRHFRSDSM